MPETPTGTPRRWANITQTAKYLGMTRRGVTLMIQDGRLTAYRNGPRVVRLDLNEVDAAMQPYHGVA